MTASTALRAAEAARLDSCGTLTMSSEMQGWPLILRENQYSHSGGIPEKLSASLILSRISRSSSVKALCAICHSAHSLGAAGGGLLSAT